MAVFGNVNGAHSLIEHTGAHTDALAAATWFTDLPPEGDSSDLGEFFSGYPLADYYVVQRTYPDPWAPRAGMVKTVAMFIPRDELSCVDLRAAFAVLRSVDDGLSALTVNDLRQRNRDDQLVPAESVALFEQMIDAPSVVWIGEGVEQAIVGVWTVLTSSDRARLTFGAAFHPGAVSLPVAEDGVTVLSSPSRFAARWAGWSAVDLQTRGSPEVTLALLPELEHSLVHDVIFTLLDGRVRLEQWQYVLAAADRLGRIEELSHQELRLLAQLLCNLAPEPRKGAEYKRLTLDALRAVTPRATFVDVRGLRALPWKSLGQAGRLEELLQPWVETVIRDTERTDELAEAIAEVGDVPDSALSAALAGVLTSEANLALDQFLDHAVLMLGRDDSETLLIWIATVVPLASLDRRLFAVDTDSARDSRWLAEFAERTRLIRTHAHVVAVDAPASAWDSHLRLRTRCCGAAAKAAEEELNRRIGPAGTIQAAFELGDPAVIAQAAIALRQTPALLRDYDVRDSMFLTIWNAAVREGLEDPWAVLSSKEAAPVLLDAAADGQVHSELLSAVANTECADISHRSDRARLWDALPAPAREKMRAATAERLAASLTRTSPIPEPILASAILEPSFLRRLALEAPDRALTALAILPNSDASAAQVVAKAGRFSREQSRELGNLIVDRDWKPAASTVADLSRVRRDLRNAGATVAKMFSTMERVGRFVGVIRTCDLVTDDELALALLDLIVRLYPSGPDDRALWERSGGDLADLPVGRTPRERWRASLRLVEDGLSSAPTAHALLAEVRKDFPKNVQARALAAAYRRR